MKISACKCVTVSMSITITILFREAKHTLKKIPYGVHICICIHYRHYTIHTIVCNNK